MIIAKFHNRNKSCKIYYNDILITSLVGNIHRLRNFKGRPFGVANEDYSSMSFVNKVEGFEEGIDVIC